MSATEFLENNAHQKQFKLMRSALNDRGLAMSSKFYNKSEHLGSGMFGSVYIGVNKYTGESIAMKDIPLPETEDEPETYANAFKKLIEEFKLLTELEHDHVMRYLGVEGKNDMMTIFMEYVAGISLNNILARYGLLSLEATRSYMRQIIRGLSFLHEEGVVHRQLQPSNILVSYSGKVKLADYGAAVVIQFVSTAGKRRLHRGTVTEFLASPKYLAPEVVLVSSSGAASSGADYEPVSDVWSCGALLIDMLTGDAPWSTSSLTSVESLKHALTMSDEKPNIPKALPPDVDDFIRCCLQTNPMQRPSSFQMARHRFVCQARVSNASSALLSTVDFSDRGSIVGAPTALRPKPDCKDMRWASTNTLGKITKSTYVVMNYRTGSFLCVKEIKLPEQKQKDREPTACEDFDELLSRLEQRVTQLRSCVHENLIQYVGTEKSPKRLYIYTEPHGKRTLRHIIDKLVSSDCMDQDRSAACRRYGRPILLALQYLHQRRIVHKNLRPENVIMCGKTCKLAKFGVGEAYDKLLGQSRMFEKDAAKRRRIADIFQTKHSLHNNPWHKLRLPKYKAPEVLSDQVLSDELRATAHRTQSTDIWSFGMMICEMVIGKVPWPEEALTSARALKDYAMSGGNTLEIPLTIDPKTRHMLVQCLSFHADERPSAQELLDHSLFKKMPKQYFNSRKLTEEKITPQCCDTCLIC